MGGGFGAMEAVNYSARVDKEISRSRSLLFAINVGLIRTATCPGMKFIIDLMIAGWWAKNRSIAT